MQLSQIAALWGKLWGGTFETSESWPLNPRYR